MNAWFALNHNKTHWFGDQEKSDFINPKISKGSTTSMIEISKLVWWL